MAGVSAKSGGGGAVAAGGIPGHPAGGEAPEGGDLVRGRSGRPVGRARGDDVGAAGTNADRFEHGGPFCPEPDLGGEPPGSFSVYGSSGPSQCQGVHRVSEEIAGQG